VKPTVIMRGRLDGAWSQKDLCLLFYWHEDALDCVCVGIDARLCDACVARPHG
jgi:hypothetical protein